MNAVLAQALAREAMKKKPELNKAEIQVKEKEPEKEPGLLTELKKASIQEKNAIEVNAKPLPKVELKKAAVKERPKIEVNSEPVVKVQLKKAAVKERPAIQVNTSPAIKVELKKTPDKPVQKAETPPSSVPTVTLRHREVDEKTKHNVTDSNEEPKLMAKLRKPGKGRFRNLEQYYN